MAEVLSKFDAAIKSVLKVLQPRTRKIVERRYGLFGGEPMTLEAIGKKEGITRERVRQIENDSLKRIRQSDDFSELNPAFASLETLFNQKGGVLPEEKLEADSYAGSARAKYTTLFLLELADFARRAKETSNFVARWYHTKTSASALEQALSAFSNEVRGEKGAMQREKFFKRLEQQLTRAGFRTTEEILENYVAVTKGLARNSWGEYGHISSPIVKPRGMKDEAYIALAKANEPLHFAEIAKRISGATGKKVHVQTVHNELIKDSRFVLVGRGLYALSEWGYKPGFVKDVIADILREGPLGEEMIIEAVTNRRFVKRSTVRTNLQNKRLFVQLDDGTYTLLS